MYLLNEFARKQGSKDKKQRLKRGLQIAGGLAATGLLAGVAIKNKSKIKQLFNKQQPTTSNTKLIAPAKLNKRIENTNKVKQRLQKIQHEVDKKYFNDIDILSKPANGLQRITKKLTVDSAAKDLRKKKEYFKSNNMLSSFYE